MASKLRVSTAATLGAVVPRFGLQHRIDRDMPAAAAAAQPVPAQQALGHQEQGRGDAAVDVHLLERLALDLAREATRRKQTGRLAEAARTSRNRAAARSPPWAAMAPMSQMQDLWLSKSVVATSNRRPRACSAATASIRASSTKGWIRASGPRPGSRSASEGRRQSAQAQQVGGVPPDIGVGQTLVPCRAEEGEGGDQGPGADPRDQGELGPRPRLGQAHQGPRAIGPARRPAGKWPACRTAPKTTPNAATTTDPPPPPKKPRPVRRSAECRKTRRSAPTPAGVRADGPWAGIGREEQADSHSFHRAPRCTRQMAESIICNVISYHLRTTA